MSRIVPMNCPRHSKAPTNPISSLFFRARQSQGPPWRSWAGEFPVANASRGQPHAATAGGKTAVQEDPVAECHGEVPVQLSAAPNCHAKCDGETPAVVLKRGSWLSSLIEYESNRNRVQSHQENA
jgi:hypothetical protein